MHDLPGRATLAVLGFHHADSTPSLTGAYLTHRFFGPNATFELTLSQATHSLFHLTVHRPGHQLPACLHVRAAQLDRTLQDFHDSHQSGRRPT